MLIKNLFTYWSEQTFSPGSLLKKKYAAFKSLLEQDKLAHELIAELEEIHHHQIRVDFSVIEKKYAALSGCVRQIVADLNRMHPTRYSMLADFFRKIDGYARHVLPSKRLNVKAPFCLQLDNIAEKNIALVGGKALNLSLMASRFKLPIPQGFVITTSAFYRFIEFNQLNQLIKDSLSAIDIQDPDSLNHRSENLVKSVRQAKVPPEVAQEIFDTFGSTFSGDALAKTVAVRSSAVGEDSDTSFAGQYQSVLNVRRDDLLSAYKAVVASKYAPEALVYRINYGLADMEAPMAVLVVEMINAMTSGVMYTQALDRSKEDQMEIHSIFGIGDLLVRGKVATDRFKVLKSEAPTIVAASPAFQKEQMKANPGDSIRIEAVAEGLQNKFSIDETSILKLARWGIQLEHHDGAAKDVEWCMNDDGQLYLLQSRPLQTDGERVPELDCQIDEIDHPVVIAKAERAAAGVAAGTVFVARDESALAQIPENAVLVTRSASARYVRAMERVTAVIAETGSAAGHFASVAREFGIPMVVNAKSATNRLKDGKTVTVYADQGLVYEGVVPSLLSNPCLRKKPIEDSPLSRKLDYILSFVSPLRLVDPNAPQFAPGGCRSLHDIIRFAHESATQEMFVVGERRFGKGRGAKKMVSHIPMLIYVMDVGGGIADSRTNAKTVRPQDITCAPFRAVWKGLNHPGVQWGDFTHFNWAEYDKIVMNGGIISAESAQLASYAVLSTDYLNLNLKFGYHFVILDTLCRVGTNQNLILFRFNGGGGDDQGRSLRAEFLHHVLRRLQFDVARTSDLIDARLSEATQSEVLEKLDLLGRLLGATRLMDMYMDAEHQVEPYVEDFLDGRYHFASVEMETPKGAKPI